MDVLAWLLAGDPAIGWQALADLTDSSVNEVSEARDLVGQAGWGAQLLELQKADGGWGEGIYSPKWTSTTYTLQLLTQFGLDPNGEPAQRAIARVQEGQLWQPGRSGLPHGPGPVPFFRYIGETCVTSLVLGIGAYFQVSDLSRSVDWLLRQQLPDGGWNCQAPARSSCSSFDTTILALEALAHYQRTFGASASIRAACTRGQEYLLVRRLFRSARTGEVIRRSWLLSSFPPRWHYDTLRGLDYLRSVLPRPDARCGEAVELLSAKRDHEGRWPVQNRHPGRQHFVLEPARLPSRWNTLRALRVLSWWEGWSGST